jgi:Spy/CpxP family protein refolding chaperone
MFNSKWWIAIAIGLVAILTATFSQAVTQKPGAQDKSVKSVVRGDASQKAAKLGKTDGDRGAGFKRAKAGFEKLALSEEQKSSAAAIRAWTRDQMGALKADSAGMDKRALMEKAAAIRSESRQRMNAVLTPEQRQQVAEMVRQFKEKRSKARKLGGGKGLCPEPE